VCVVYIAGSDEWQDDENLKHIFVEAGMKIPHKCTITVTTRHHHMLNTVCVHVCACECVSVFLV